ncbi:MAG: HNH endonuclease [Muribaculaceae bacterium]|nr:HNH endonuclease [Muribaculaceae bacterium]
MAISEKSRKYLWGKSGNRCAICKAELVNTNNENKYYIIGEECHIVSSKPTGPRFEANLEDYDNENNLILLCRNHHKEIDDLNNISIYPKEKLKNIKREHEAWVKENLSETNYPQELYLITTGIQLFSILEGVKGIEKSNDPVSSKEEAEFLGSIWQLLSDYCDIYSDLEPARQTMVNFEFDNYIREITEKGFFIYANRYNKKIKFSNGTTSYWPTAFIRIILKRNVNNKSDIQEN